MDLTNSSERRIFPRKRALRGGRMVFNNASSTINCTLRNISDAGARLDVASVLGIPAGPVKWSGAVLAPSASPSPPSDLPCSVRSDRRRSYRPTA